MKPGDLVHFDREIFGWMLDGGNPILLLKGKIDVMGSPYLVLINPHTGAEFVDKAENYRPVDS